MPPTNVNAANPAQAVDPSGAQLRSNQFEPSIAATGRYVVAAWNDTTGNTWDCPAPGYKDQGIGFGFSSDGGATFTDLDGLPNDSCAHRYAIDSSVAAWRAGGRDYFYIAGDYRAQTADAQQQYIAVTACEATGSGRMARLSCGQPIPVAQGSHCRTGSTGTTCDFVDKPFLALDPAHGRLYVAYHELSPPVGVDLSMCELGDPSGRPGPLGATPLRPVCPQPTGSVTPPPAPYLMVAPPDSLGCTSFGAFPAVDSATGDVYVATQYNSLGGDAACANQPSRVVITRVPASCLTVSSSSPCGTPHQTRAVTISSEMVPVGRPSPFPRIAVSGSQRTVSIVWAHTGVFLQSYRLGSLEPVQSAPVQLNEVTGGGGFHPALRTADANGNLNVTWNQDRDTYAALGVNPLTSSPPLVNVRISDMSTASPATSTDYADSYVLPTGRPGTAGTLVAAWTDNRLGWDQPFTAAVPLRYRHR